MRTLFGMILGALITVGAAYIYDTQTLTTGAAAERPMVNWDVVSQKWEFVSARASAEWKRLAG
jgi:hypothetical protein